MMISWVMAYANHKYDLYMIIRARRFQESNFRMDLNEVVDKKNLILIDN